MCVRVSVLVSVRMDGAIGMPVLVGVDVRVDVGMGVFVLDDLGHYDLSLGAGENPPPLPPWEVISPPMGVEFYTKRPRAASQWAQYDNARIGKMASSAGEMAVVVESEPNRCCLQRTTGCWSIIRAARMDQSGDHRRPGRRHADAGDDAAEMFHSGLPGSGPLPAAGSSHARSRRRASSTVNGSDSISMPLSRSS